MGAHSHSQICGSITDDESDGFFAKHRHLRSPRLVQWLVTSRCPLSCPHCLSANDEQGQRELNLQAASALIEQVASLSVDELLLTGGEPAVRVDLPDIIAGLAAAKIPWSLNTALMPPAELRRSMERWPPRFVAVSVDGPDKIHDAFRGRQGCFDQAMEAIAYYAEIASCGVAAGTTVTRVNFDSLGETFGLVVASGATSWGLHLPFAEGRARNQPALFPSQGQIGQLLQFTAAKREHFPINLADEIGFCGAFEPLVRDTPFFCGAGRAGCAVLPDGEVVPCTSMDRSASAGNVQNQKLSEIWRTGFDRLRSGRLEGECRRCRFSDVCQGGCWLQRRNHNQCFKPVWEHRTAPRAAAVLLGLALTGTLAVEPAPVAARPATEKDQREGSKMEVVQRAIVQWYAAQIGGRRAPRLTVLIGKLEKLSSDPAARYALAFIKGQRPVALKDRAARITAALKTRQRSLCLIGMAWRDLAEWTLDGPGPQQRTDAERSLLRRSLLHLGQTAETWRKQIFAQKLDPFLRKTQAYRWFFMSKAGPPPWMRMERGMAAKRGWTRPDLKDDFLAAHRHAETMELAIEAPPGVTLRQVAAPEDVVFDGRLGVFDLIRMPADEKSRSLELVVVAGPRRLALRTQPGAELSYADVLRLVADQNPAAVEQLTDELMRNGRPRTALPLALPVLRARLKKARSLPESDSKAQEQIHRLTWWLTDLYLF